MLIVLADQLGRSVGDMYTGALVPGLMLAGFYAVFVFFVATFFPAAAPGLPPEALAFAQAGRQPRLHLACRCWRSLGTIAAFAMQQAPPYPDADLVILTLGLAVAIAFARRDRELRPQPHVGARRFLSPLAEQVVFVMVPPLLLIFLVLGTIFVGIATPTEGGAMGAVGAILLALAKRIADPTPRGSIFAHRALGRSRRRRSCPPS